MIACRFAEMGEGMKEYGETGSARYLLRGGYLLVRSCMTHRLSTQSAALAFYLLFTLFPLLIFFSALLGLLHLEQETLLSGIGHFLPADVQELAASYLDYVARNSSMRILLFGLFFSLHFPARAANALIRAVRTAYRLGAPQSPVRHILRTLFYTVTLLVTVVLALILLTAGRRLLDWAAAELGLPVEFAVLWRRLRFPVTALLMYFALFLLYAVAQDARRPVGDLWPGAVAALFGWMGVSLIYSLYVERVASYSLLYGPLGTAVVLLIWLHLSSAVLILGAECNGVLIALRRERLAERSEYTKNVITGGGMPRKG